MKSLCSLILLFSREGLQPYAKNTMLEILNIITPIFFVIIAGYICGKLDFLGHSAVSILNKLIYYVFLPALIFSLTASAQPSDLSRLDFVGLFFIASVLTIAVGALGIPLLKGRNRREKVVFLMSSSIGNTGYMGIPLLLGVFGKIGGVAAITGSIMVNTPLSVCTVCLLGFLSDKKISPWQNIYKIFRNPFVISSIMGILVAFTEIPLPLFITKTVNLMGSPTIGLALFTIGLSLAGLRPAPKTLVEASWVSFVKLLISPLLVVALYPLFPDLDPTWKACAVLLAATPVASNNYVIANSAASYVEECVTAILISTSVSLLSLAWFIHFLTA